MVITGRLSRARQILEAHNQQSSAAIDIDSFFKKLKEMGGTTEDALSEATWEDLQDCGAPRILARKIAVEFRGEEKADHGPLQKVLIEDNDPTKRALRLTPGELISEYDPQHPKNPIGERLKALAEGRRFLVFQESGKIDVLASIQLFDELDDYGERNDFSVGGVPRKVYKVGDRPGRSVDEHPLLVGVPLRSNGCSEADCNWGEVSLKIRQIYRLAVNLGELNPDDYREADLHTEATTRDEAEIFRIYRKASVKWQELEGIDNLPSLKVILGGKTKPESSHNHPFGQNRAT